ncbi:MAG: hypothetical protein IT348_10980 [Candidatus Eisenbacteria bacterium]|nr:hypothetical protein [Candidatus Eisenbacteria bacterium]
MWAELRGKLSATTSLERAERWEDVLTSSVFGTLRYLSDDVLCACLRAARNLRGKHLAIADDTAWDLDFWPNRLGWVREPDVVVTGRDRFTSAVRQLVVVEVKYRSGKSNRTDASTLPEDDPVCPARVSGDQLSDLLEDARREVGASGVHVSVVYLTAHLTMPTEQLQESVAALADASKSAADEIYWVGWMELDRVLARCRSEASGPRQHLAALDDLRALLQRRGLGYFSARWPSVRQPGPWLFQTPMVASPPTGWRWPTDPVAGAGWRFDRVLPVGGRLLWPVAIPHLEPNWRFER